MPEKKVVREAAWIPICDLDKSDLEQNRPQRKQELMDNNVEVSLQDFRLSAGGGYRPLFSEDPFFEAERQAA